jgi:hypothetical protein
MRVAIIFFGIARGLERTVGSIRRNLYDCNAGDGIVFHTIASLNLVATVDNPRNGEVAVPLDPRDAFLLDADTYALVRQDDAAIAAALAAAMAQRDLFGNDWISVRNALHQLAALRRAWRLCADGLHGRFDYVLFARPDLIYLDEIRIAAIVESFRGQGNVALPAWQCHGPGFNDRFALADAGAARAYAERLDLVPEYCARRAFHPEHFLSYALAQGHTKVCKLPTTAQRVRANGNVVAEDFGAFVVDLPATPRGFTLAPAGVRWTEEPAAAPRAQVA